MQTVPGTAYASFMGWVIPTVVPAPTVPTLAEVLAKGNTSGPNDIVMESRFIMPSEGVNTTNLFNVTRVPGVPTSAGVAAGSLVFDTVGQDLYFYDGGAWVVIPTGGGASTWSAVLATGNTSGANDPIISASRSLTFEAGVRIGGNNASSLLGDAFSINIGENTATSSTESVTVGYQNVNNFYRGVVIGKGCTVSANNATAIGVSCTASADSVAIGFQSTAAIFATSLGYQATGTGANGVSIGTITTCNGQNGVAVGNTATLSGLGSIAIGSTADAGPGIANIVIGNTCSTPGITGQYNTCIGQISTVTALGDQNIAIGAAVSIAGDATADNNVAIGSNITLTGNSGNRICIGQAANAAAEGSVAVGYQCTAAISATSMGYLATGTGPNSVSIGTITNCSAFNSVAIGNTATASAVSAVAIGTNVLSSGVSAVAFGRDTTASATDSIAIGRDATSGGLFSIALGILAATGTGQGNLCIGYSVSTPGVTGISNSCIGQTCTITALGDQNIAFGASVSIAGNANSDNNVAIGSNITMTGNVANRIAIGQLATTNSADGVAIGRSTTANSTDGVAIGRQANSDGATSAAVGGLATASATQCTAFGYNARARAADQVAIGYNATAGQAGPNNTVVGSQAAVTNVSASATNNTVLGQSASVTGITANCTVLGRGATGTTSNSVYFQTGLTTVAATVAVNYDTATGRLYPVTSSIRYKEDVKDFRDSSDILSIQPKIYAFKHGHCGCKDCEEGKCSRREVGYIAEELEKVFPELCSYSYDSENNKRVESIQYDRLVLLLIPEVRKVLSRVEELESRFLAK